MVRRRLPIGIQTFRKLREQDCYYVDKTAYLDRLLHEGTHYFLSRPRRFGKSLFLDTLKELFEGNEELFAGLYVHQRHNWSERHPVVRLSFGGGNFKEPATLHKDVMAQLDGLARDMAITVRYDTAPARFRHLLQALHKETGRRVAVLVDEYDKPILDALVEQPEVARANRDYLRGLYGVIKDSDAHVGFTFLTGITKFSKVNLFSQLNNLTDLTLDRRYSSICGYTERDLETVFAPELGGLDREQVREWYNGYSWRGDGEGVQPVRRAAAVRQPRVRRALVRDRDAGVPGGHAVRAAGVIGGVGRDGEHREAAVGVRRGGDRHGGAAVPDRLPDHHRRGDAGRTWRCTGWAIRTGRCGRA